VLQAAGAREAIALAQARPLDVVVVDYGLPELDGMRVLAEIRKARPSVAAVVSSGRVSPELKAEAERHGALALEKPYRIAALVAAIESALKEPA